MKSRIVVLGVYAAAFALGCEGTETADVAGQGELVMLDGFADLAGVLLFDQETGEEAGAFGEDGSIRLDNGFTVPGSKVEWWEESFDPIEPLEVVGPFDPMPPIDDLYLDPRDDRPAPTSGSEPSLVLETSACPGSRCCDFEVVVTCEGVVCSAEVVGICQ
jgi:hypothetical protein